jgi:Cu(I)/Ag(I) efflux system membrane protein CusA/SilA
MMETTIQLKPQVQWRHGLTLPKLIEELDERVRIPGLTNSWQMPIATRIDMLATGIKTSLGVKVAGPDLRMIDAIGAQIESLLRPLPGTASIYADRISQARYIDIDVDRAAAAHYGLNVADLYDVIGTAVGGMNITYTVRVASVIRSTALSTWGPQFADCPQRPTRVSLYWAAIAACRRGRRGIKDGPEMIRAKTHGWPAGSILTSRDAILAPTL